MNINLDVYRLTSLRDYVETITSMLYAQGLTLGIGNDIRDWKRLMMSQPGTPGVSRALDPAVNDLHPGNSYWVYIRNNDGQAIACQADRLIQTDDFMRRWIMTNRLFGDREPTLQWRPQGLPESLPDISGHVVFGGGTWVHPKWRGLNLYSVGNNSVSLGAVMSRTGRIMGVQNYWLDNFATVIKDARRFGKATGIPHHAPLTRGFYSGRAAEMDMDVFWMSREEIFDAIIGELDYIDTASTMRMGRIA